MTDDHVTSLDQTELIKKLKSIGVDLWGGKAQDDAPEAAPPAETAADKKRPSFEKASFANRRAIGIDNLWKTADETIDWTDALAHGSPTDGLTGRKLWNFYHKQAARVLAGDLDAYTEVLKAANPLGELTDFAEGISIRAVSADRLESTFTCKPDLMKEKRERYLSAMAVRIARDLFACLPVSEVTVRGEMEGHTVFEVSFRRLQLLHLNFMFLDPVALCRECGATFS